nr:anthocyanidin-3-glucoside rhamnosyltransferase 2 [Aglaonema commutatum]
MDRRKVTVVFVPLPFIGHLVPAVQMAKQLLGGRRRHTFSVTVLTLRPLVPFGEMASYMDSMASSGLDMHFEELPSPEGDLVTLGNQSPEAIVSLYVERYRPCVRDAVARLSLGVDRPVGAMMMDLFCTALIDVATELGIRPYIYFASSASMLGFMLYTPTLDVLVPSGVEEIGHPIDIPGLQSPVPPLAMPTPMMHKKDSGYTWFLYHARRFREVQGIIVNTFSELEPVAVSAHEEGLFLRDHSTAPTVYTVGPNIALEFRAGPKHECLGWLDGQPPTSVVFLCFGSWGRFAGAQVKETATGLERSGHRFLWVLRSPPKHAHNFPTDTVNLREVLPEGFLERTAGRGLVWPSWAPQVDVLAHPSIGGFVTHCGWNSCLESLWFGVPMLAWPLYAEQHFNAFQMAGDLGVALQLKVDRKNGNFVAAEELERGVRCLMEEGFCERGRKVRARAKEMKTASRRALEDGGSSLESMERLADELVGGVAGVGEGS